MTDRVEELFKAALDVPTSEREAFVAGACTDEGVREEVEALLAADADAATFLRSPLRSLAEAEFDAPEGRMIGPYRLIRRVGTGGMGMVYEAEQESPRRRVALKMLRGGAVNASSLRRFAQEIEVLAQMRHPGIAQIFDAGSHEGMPYFAMEYFEEAAPLTSYAKDGAVSVRGRLELVAKVCDAIHHGHQRGVIHRDIKPSNVLVDAHGEPKVIDFGVARASDLDGATLQTATGQLVGTMPYMSPEQCEGDPRAIDVRSDVYALGVLTYELLTGSLPYEADASAPGSLILAIRDAPPRPPSAIDRALRGDLETIMLTALQKEPDRRYPSAQALGRDIRRYLQGAAIEAKRDDAWYVLRKALARFRWQIIALLVGVAVLLASAAAWLFERQARTQERLVAAEKTAAQVERVRQSDYALRIIAAQAAYENANVGRAQELLAGCPEGLRRWEWYRLRLLTEQSVAKLDAGARVTDVEYSPDGRLAAASTEQGVVRLWSLPRFEPAATLRGHEGPVWAIAFSLDGRKIVTGGEDVTVRLWDVASGREERTLRGHVETVGAVAFSPSGRFVASSGDSPGVFVWDLEQPEGRPTFLPEEANGQTLLFLPDGRLLSGTDSVLSLFDVASRERIWSRRDDLEGVDALALSPDGKDVASSGWGEVIHISDVETGVRKHSFAGHRGGVLALRYTPDGSGLISAGVDDRVRLWNLRIGYRAREFQGHAQNVVALDVSPDGAHIMSGSQDNTVRLWEVEGGSHSGALKGHREKIHALVYAAAGDRVITGAGPHFGETARDNTVRIWDSSSGEEVHRLVGHTGTVGALDVQGGLIASGSRDKTVRLWALEDGGLDREPARKRGPCDRSEPRG